MITEVQSQKEAEDKFQTVTEIGHAFHAFCYLNFNNLLFTISYSIK